MGRVKSEFQDRIEAAQDRGLTDAYYGRPANPNMWLDSLGTKVLTREQMTREEIAAYREGYDNQDDRKDWGEDAQEC